MAERPGGADGVDPAHGTGDVAYIAHRGFAGTQPENTLTAFAHAAGVTGGAAPADAVELDVMPTADGEVVAFHDDDLRRLTDAPPALRHRPVWETPYARLERLDVLDSGESIPRLSEVLDIVPPDVAVNVEFKNPGSADVEYGRLDGAAVDRERRRWRPFVEDVLDVASRYPHDLLASSFAEGAVAAVRAVDPGVETGFIFYDSVADGLAVARRYDCEAVHLPWNMVYGTAMFNQDYVAPAPFEPVDLVATTHAEGRRVNVWTVDDPLHAVELARAGVDGIVADSPGLLAADGPEDGARRAAGSD